MIFIMIEKIKKVHEASNALLTDEIRNKILKDIASSLEKHTHEILKENEKEVDINFLLLPTEEAYRKISYVKEKTKDFAATNPGVWCHNIHDLQDRSKFTDWSKYTKDKTL